MSVDAVGFDLDYTLCVPERDRETLLAEAVEAAGAPPLPQWTSRTAYREAHSRNLTGETRAPVFEDLLDGADAEGDPDDLARVYRERVNEALVPVEGAMDLVSRLRERYRVGLLTNGPVVAQRSKLAALGWEDAFDAVLISGDLAAGKPDRRAFEALCSALSVGTGEAVYVGDEVEADVAGASAAGLYVVQVVFPGGPDPDPRADAHVEQGSLAADLAGVIESL